MKSVNLVYVLATLILVLSSNSYAHAQTFSESMPQSLPAPTPITTFRAVGIDNQGDTLNVSSQGGDFAFNGTRIHLIPWHTAYWNPSYWIIFLVNVTANDFYSLYLYLTNQTNQAFGLYLFHYANGGFSFLAFTGEQFISNSSQPQPPAAIPQLSIEPAARFANRLYASGPSLHISGNEGTFNGTRIYSLLNLYNITSAGTTWNELWVLRTDGASLYFAILYMFNNNHSTIDYEYELRLNDLTARYTERPVTVTASWHFGTPHTTTPASHLEPTSTFSSTSLATLMLTIASAAYAALQRRRNISQHKASECN